MVRTYHKLVFRISFPYVIMKVRLQYDKSYGNPVHDSVIGWKNYALVVFRIGVDLLQ